MMVKRGAALEPSVCPSWGSLAIIIEAARNGHIPAAGPAIKDLRRSGIYLADSLVREALARALGEAWEP